MRELVTYDWTDWEQLPDSFTLHFLFRIIWRIKVRNYVIDLSESAFVDIFYIPFYVRTSESFIQNIKLLPKPWALDPF